MGLLPETALARHRRIGGQARGACIALGQGKFLSHFRARSEEHLVRRLPTRRWMRHLRVVLVDVEFHRRANTRHRVQGVQEQPLMLQRPPICLDERIEKGDLDLGKHAVQACCGQDGIHGAVHVLYAGIGIHQRPTRGHEMLARRKRWNGGSARAWQRPWRRNERHVREGDGRRRAEPAAGSRQRESSQKASLHLGKPQRYRGRRNCEHEVQNVFVRSWAECGSIFAEGRDFVALIMVRRARLARSKTRANS
jgi:hypothetical protein